MQLKHSKTILKKLTALSALEKDLKPLIKKHNNTQL